MSRETLSAWYLALATSSAFECICSRKSQKWQLLSTVTRSPELSCDDPASHSFVSYLPGWIIQWRGEGTEGYSISLRHWEFTSAFKAEMADFFDLYFDMSPQLTELRKGMESIQFNFHDALTYQGPIYTSPSEEIIHNGSDDGIKPPHSKDSEGEPIPLAQAQAYESAMQYVSCSFPSTFNLLLKNLQLQEEGLDQQWILNQILQNTVERCSLIRNAFQIVAEGDSYEQLAEKALKNSSFKDLMEGGANANATWSIRLRRYGDINEIGAADKQLVVEGEEKDIDSENTDKTRQNKKRQARYGKNVRSPLTDERNAILSMANLVKLFRGKVKLERPECRIYLMEGLRSHSSLKRPDGKIGADGGCRNNDDDFVNNDQGVENEMNNILLARVVAQGPKTSIYAPNKRICITTTPLCPIASFSLCNIAQLRRFSNATILDPFAGSCATLLAASHITSIPASSRKLLPKPLEPPLLPVGCRSVGIEICHNGYVNRDNIVEDFKIRSLPPPVQIIRGDCLSSQVREQARMAVGGEGFEHIITDPPYGIREAMVSESIAPNNDGEFNCSVPPLTQLFHAMGRDRAKGTPLLKPGGRLVAFIPVRSGETLDQCLPDAKTMKAAGLKVEGEGKEQVLSDLLSRWLVSFVSE